MKPKKPRIFSVAFMDLMDYILLLFKETSPETKRNCYQVPALNL